MTVWFFVFLGLSGVVGIVIVLILLLYIADSKEDYFHRTVNKGSVVALLFVGMLLIVTFISLAFSSRDNYNKAANAIQLINLQHNTEFTVDDWRYNEDLVREIILGKGRLIWTGNPK